MISQGRSIFRNNKIKLNQYKYAKFVIIIYSLFNFKLQISKGEKYWLQNKFVPNVILRAIINLIIDRLIQEVQLNLKLHYLKFQIIHNKK